MMYRSECSLFFAKWNVKPFFISKSSADVYKITKKSFRKFIKIHTKFCFPDKKNRKKAQVFSCKFAKFWKHLFIEHLRRLYLCLKELQSIWEQFLVSAAEIIWKSQKNCVVNMQNKHFFRGVADLQIIWSIMKGIDKTFWPSKYVPSYFLW